MKLTINHPHFPEGDEISIAGLAAVPNGDTVELDDEAVKLFEEENGIPLKEAIKNNPFVGLDGEDLKKKQDRLKKESEATSREEPQQPQPQQQAPAEGGEE